MNLKLHPFVTFWSLHHSVQWSSNVLIHYILVRETKHCRVIRRNNDQKTKSNFILKILLQRRDPWNASTFESIVLSIHYFSVIWLCITHFMQNLFIVSLVRSKVLIHLEPKHWPFAFIFATVLFFTKLDDTYKAKEHLKQFKVFVS